MDKNIIGFNLSTNIYTGNVDKETMDKIILDVENKFIEIIDSYKGIELLNGKADFLYNSENIINK